MSSPFLQYIVYAFYNLIVFIASLWGVIFMNTYINEALIPKALKRNFPSEMLLRFFLANIEAGILLFIIYQINKKYLSGFVKTKTNVVANWTGVASLVLMLIITGVIFFWIYKSDK